MALSTGNWSIAGATATGTTGKLHENTYIKGKERVAHLKLTMAASGWPAAGIAMPAFGSIGFYRNIALYEMSSVFASAGKYHATRALMFEVSSTGNKVMRCVRSVLASGTGESFIAATQVLTAAQTFFVTAKGW